MQTIEGLRSGLSHPAAAVGAAKINFGISTSHSSLRSSCVRRTEPPAGSLNSASTTPVRVSVRRPLAVRATTFTKNLERLLKHEVGQALFGEVVLEADRQGLLSDEHFTMGHAVNVLCRSPNPEDHQHRSRGPLLSRAWLNWHFGARVQTGRRDELSGGFRCVGSIRFPGTHIADLKSLYSNYSAKRSLSA